MTPTPKHRKAKPKRPKSSKNTETQPQNSLDQLRSAQKLLRLVEHGQAGTAIIVQLVTSTNARERDKPVLTAIHASVESRLAAIGVDDPDITKWVMAANLAAYELGKTNHFKPPTTNHKTAN